MTDVAPESLRGLARHVRRSARAWRRGEPAILLYHRVAEEQHDPWELCVHPDRFAEHMAVLAASRRPVLPLTELAAAFTAGTAPRRAVALSFDDGYLDNLEEAAPVLDRLGLPATVFVTTGAIGRPSLMWWDVLVDVMLRPDPSPGLQLRVGGFDLDVPADDGVDPDVRWRHPAEPPSPRHQSLVDVWSRLLSVSTDERATALDQLIAALGAPPADERRRMLTAEEVVKLDHFEGIDVGAHTVSHASLPRITHDERDAEITGAKATLEELLDRPVPAFAYPYGHTDNDCARAARRAGFDFAVTTNPITVFRHADPFLLPRIPMIDEDGAAFERRLAWLG
jgi:peptidoglycan/xylan/chitin deacetylase (PgdA/CDA1 family)